MPLATWPPEFLERAQEMVIWLSVLVAMVVAQGDGGREGVALAVTAAAQGQIVTYGKNSGAFTAQSIGGGGGSGGYKRVGLWQWRRHGRWRGWSWPGGRWLWRWCWQGSRRGHRR